MENKTELYATVKSPTKDSHLRKSSGFSLKEVIKAGKSANQLAKLGIKIDYFRKSLYPENVDRLKSFKLPDEKREKKKPFVKKERKRTPYKPKELKSKAKPKVTPKSVIDKVPYRPIVKEKEKPAKKEKKKALKEEKIKIEKEGTQLTELSGLGAATAKKFIELGVNTIEELCKENPEELASLIKGISANRCKNWIEEGKELIK
ncbi:MAG: helix-hairpin-helix domain-containing protein [Promethearchaeota archaeon]